MRSQLDLGAISDEPKRVVEVEGEFLRPGCVAGDTSDLKVGRRREDLKGANESFDHDECMARRRRNRQTSVCKREAWGVISTVACHGLAGVSGHSGPAIRASINGCLG